MSEWQPIETAPKDGTRVLYYTPNDGVLEGNEPPGHIVGNWHIIDGEWRGHATEALSATHWMPLPESPA